MGDDPLDSPRYLLARARELAAEFRVEKWRFFDSNPFSAFTETDSRTDEEVVKCRLDRRLPFRVNGVVFDAVVNLRNALDHCGFAFAKVPSGRAPRTAFPFCDNPNELPGRNINGRSKDIPKEIFSAMVAFKPYKGGDDLLWCLNKIANGHKHHLVRPVAMMAGGVQYIIRPEQVAGQITFKFPTWDSRKNEIELYRSGPGSSHKNADVTIAHDIVFGKVPVVEGKNVSAVLDAFISKVESVIGAVAAEARTKGLYGWVAAITAWEHFVQGLQTIPS